MIRSQVYWWLANVCAFSPHHHLTFWDRALKRRANFDCAFAIPADIAIEEVHEIDERIRRFHFCRKIAGLRFGRCSDIRSGLIQGSNFGNAVATVSVQAVVQHCQSDSRKQIFILLLVVQSDIERAKRHFVSNTTPVFST